uniref:Transmembrane protein 179Bb n=1 Tax=Lepisosteus oculatus TaxID=7918 RepID=W5M2I0_LEPOC
GSAMALPWLVAVELLLYGGCFICGIIAASSVTVTQGEFSGQCVLWGSVRWANPVVPLCCRGSSRASVCCAVLCCALLIQLCCIVLCCAGLIQLCRCVAGESLWMTVSLAVCAVFLFFLLVTGCILRIGRDRLCQSALKDSGIHSCQEAEGKNWASPYTGQHFYSNLHTAETSVWVNFFLWVLVFALLVIQKKRGSEFSPLSAGDPEWSTSEADPIFPRPS